MKRKTAFTLVELLVVIGIIALLLSILLPTLSRAQDSARTVMCAANLRSIGQGLMTYANDNNGYLVPGDYIDAANNTRENWATILVYTGHLPAPSQSVGGTPDFNQTSEGRSVFRCPEGLDNRSTFPVILSQQDMNGAMFTRQLSYDLRPSPTLRIDNWYGVNGWTGSTSSEAYNEQAFTQYPFTRVRPAGPPAPFTRLHKMSSIRPASDIVLMFDGIGFHQQDGRRVNARHGARQTTNFLFADGHVMASRTADLPVNTTFNSLSVNSGYTPRMRLDKP